MQMPADRRHRQLGDWRDRSIFADRRSDHGDSRFPVCGFGRFECIGSAHRVRFVLKKPSEETAFCFENVIKL